MPTPTPPDLLDLTIRALLAHPATTARVADRVYAEKPAVPQHPLWIVSLIDDTEIDGDGSIRGRLQVDQWMGAKGPEAKATAFEHARTLKGIHRDLRGAYVGGRITSTGHLSTVWLPDPVTGNARVATDLEIEAYPL